MNLSARHVTPASPRKTRNIHPSTKHANWLSVTIPRNIITKNTISKKEINRRTQYFINQLVYMRNKYGMTRNIERKLLQLRGLKNHAKHVPTRKMFNESLRNIMLGNRKS
jgi:hypothetical protein